MKKQNCAKINLALNVINKSKPKTLHDLEMVNVTVSLKDLVKIKFINDNNNNITIKCNMNNVPVDNSNLIYQVIEKFKKVYKLSFSCIVILNKKIPVSAGLAGGSGNASATLDILNKKFKTKMSIQQKAKFLLPLTADGPYMVYSSPCKIKGIDNHINKIKYNLKGKMLIIKPMSGCNTKDVFSSLNYQNITRCNINKVIESLEKNDIKLLSNHINNSLLDSACNINKDIQDIINRLKTCDFEIVSMSGSGSTCFAISNRKYPFKKAKEIFNKNNYELFKICKVYR